MKKQWCLLALLLVRASFFAHGAETDEFQQLSFTVEGVARTALVYVPATAKTVSTPLVFVFHGHGGNSRQVARSFAMNRQWPEAISVYMQGLNTPGQLTDPEGNRPGWQAAVGNQGDRDLKFFDAVLARLKQDYHVDPGRIYCTGHSNGGGFTYLLWLARSGVFAAVAPSAAAARYADKLTPKPALILGGRNDPLVKFAWQERAMDAVRTIYRATNCPPLVTGIFPGGHQFNPAAPALIVKFFKEHPGTMKE